MKLNKNLTKNFKLDYLIFIFLLFSISLIKLPSIYLLFFLKNKLFTTFTLSKFFIFLTFLLTLFLKSRKKQLNIFFKQKKIFFGIFLIYIFTSSFSVIKAIDVISFVKSYHSLILGIFLFLTTSIILFKNKKFLSVVEKFIYLLGFIIISLELIFYLLPQSFIFYFKDIIQKELMDSYLFNIDRGRFTLELNPEYFLPFFMFSSLILKTKKSKLFLLISFLIIFLSFVSNFRTRFLMSILVILSYLIYFRKKLSISNKIFILPLILIIFLFSIFLNRSNLKITILDRVINNNEILDGQNSYRLSSLKNTLEIFINSPFLGVGLGNFYLYNDYANNYKYSLVKKDYVISYNELVRYSPHNIFLEVLSQTGILSFLSFTLVIIIFLFQDYKVLKTRSYRYFPFIVSSWVCFFYLLFNPSYSLFSTSWFWFMRGVAINLAERI
jgi:O-antigen ligase